jgi:hypothetical protein
MAPKKKKAGGGAGGQLTVGRRKEEKAKMDEDDESDDDNEQVLECNKRPRRATSKVLSTGIWQTGEEVKEGKERNEPKVKGDKEKEDGDNPEMAPAKRAKKSGKAADDGNGAASGGHGGRAKGGGKGGKGGKGKGKGKEGAVSEDDEAPADLRVVALDCGALIVAFGGGAPLRGKRAKDARVIAERAAAASKAAILNEAELPKILPPYQVPGPRLTADMRFHPTNHGPAIVTGAASDANLVIPVSDRYAQDFGRHLAFGSDSLWLDPVQMCRSFSLLFHLDTCTDADEVCVC